MALATGRRPKATSVSKQAVDQAGVLLQQLPEKPRESLSLRDAIDQLQDEIKDALAKGYTYIDLVSLLANKGIEISPATLKRYVSMGRGKAAKTRKTAAKTGVRRTRKAADDSDNTSSSETSDSAVSEATSKSEGIEIAAKSTRKRSSAAQSAKAAAEEPAEASVKQTTRRRTRGSTAKPTGRPAGRGRKKGVS